MNPLDGKLISAKFNRKDIHEGPDSRVGKDHSFRAEKMGAVYAPETTQVVRVDNNNLLVVVLMFALIFMIGLMLWRFRVLDSAVSPTPQNAVPTAISFEGGTQQSRTLESPTDSILTPTEMSKTAEVSTPTSSPSPMPAPTDAEASLLLPEVPPMTPTQDPTIDPRECRVLNEAVWVRQGPGIEYQVLYGLPQGSIVLVLEHRLVAAQEWLRIVATSGYENYAYTWIWGSDTRAVLCPPE